MLKVEGLKAGYGAINILWDLSFEVHEGEIVAILGSNGAGKTTMVRAITGMVRPSAGSVNFNGEELAKKSSRYILDKGIVQVPEGRQIFTDMTVLENLEMGAFSKPTKAAFPKNLETAYRRFPKLKERAKQAAGTLSGGEQQMLAVARALIGMPKLTTYWTWPPRWRRTTVSPYFWWSRTSPRRLPAPTGATSLKTAVSPCRAPPGSSVPTSMSRRRIWASDLQHAIAVAAQLPPIHP